MAQHMCANKQSLRRLQQLLVRPLGSDLVRSLAHPLKCTRVLPRVPCANHGANIVFDRQRGKYFEVVKTECVGRFEVRSRLTNPPITALLLSALEFLQGAVKADEEHIHSCEEMDKALHPGLRLNDVFNDEIVSGSGKSGQTAVKSFKERGAQIAPYELSGLDA